MSLISSSFIIETSAEATPSVYFKTTFPIKPSQTNTSYSPVRISLASQLPIKFIGVSFISLNAAFVSSLPFSSSAPLFIRPTRGSRIPITFCIYALPIIANCCRYWGLQSTLAPQSINSTGPFTVGRIGANAGLFTPFIRRTISVAPASTAPVLPAETNASAPPFATSSSAFTSDESFFLFIAMVGCSSHDITIGA